jgi:hypothetical protein
MSRATSVRGLLTRPVDVPAACVEHVGHALDDDRTLEEAARMIAAPMIAAELRRVMSVLQGDLPPMDHEPDDGEAGFATGLELAVSRLNYRAHQVETTSGRGA